MKPLIYTTPDCPYCHDLLDWLDEKNIPYEEIDAGDMEEIELVPETHIGDDVFRGVKKRAILKSLRKHHVIN